MLNLPLASLKHRKTSEGIFSDQRLPHDRTAFAARVQARFSRIRMLHVARLFPSQCLLIHFKKRYIFRLVTAKEPQKSISITPFECLCPCRQCGIVGLELDPGWRERYPTVPLVIMKPESTSVATFAVYSMIRDVQQKSEPHTCRCHSVSR